MIKDTYGEKINVFHTEMYGLIFDNGDYTNTNEFGLIRFIYKDILGNKYYQDLPIQYLETDHEGIVEQVIEISRLQYFIKIK